MIVRADTVLRWDRDLVARRRMWAGGIEAAAHLYVTMIRAAGRPVILTSSG